MSCPECGRKYSYSFDAGYLVKSAIGFIFGLGALGLMVLGAATLHQGWVEELEYRIKHPDEYRKRLQSDREWMEMYEAAQP